MWRILKSGWSYFFFELGVSLWFWKQFIHKSSYCDCHPVSSFFVESFFFCGRMRTVGPTFRCLNFEQLKNEKKWGHDEYQANVEKQHLTGFINKYCARAHDIFKHIMGFIFVTQFFNIQFVFYFFLCALFNSQKKPNLW